MKSLIIIWVILLYILFPIEFNLTAQSKSKTKIASRIYVNPTYGSDSGRDGRDSTLPIKTLNRAGVVCINGDTIFIRGGIHYAINDHFTRHNNQDGWVYIMPYFNESVTLVGTGTIPDWDAIITIESSNKIYIKGLKLINNGSLNEGVGLRVNSFYTNRTSRDIIIDSCIVNNTKRQGILIQGNYTTVKNCKISNAVMMNKNEINCDWVAALQAFGYPPQLDFCYQIKFIDNYIDSCWGEGINLVKTDTFYINNNIVKDCYSQCIYLDNSYNGEINKNWLFSSSDVFNKYKCQNPPYSYSAPAGGIFWAAENNGYANDRMIENIKIYNNFIYRTSPAFGWFHDNSNTFLNNSYRYIYIYYNTVYNLISYESFYIQPYSGPRNPPSGCYFINNIIPKGRYNNQVQTYFTSSADYFDTTKWIFKKNCFIDGFPVGFPPDFYTNNIQGNPSFENPNNNSPYNFKLSVNSNCKDAGLVIPYINTDYFNALRDSTPCIGFHEFGGISLITPIGKELPNEFTLIQNSPNPFNAMTKIKFGIPNSVKIKYQLTNLTVFDILGREVAVLINENLEPGYYELLFDGRNLASGIYFYILQTGEFKKSKIMISIK